MTLRRCLTGLLTNVIVVLGWLLTTPSAIAVGATAVPLSVKYDAPIRDDPYAENVSERGPPTTYGYVHHDTSVDHGSHGVSARSSGTTTAPTTTYTTPTQFVHAPRATTRGGHVRVADGDLSSFQRLRVAAKTGANAVADVGDVLKGLPKGRSSGVRTVGSDQELGDLYGTLSRGGMPVEVPGYKGSWVELPDGTRVRIRDASKSGGRTIDIKMPDGTTQKVHIDE